MLFLAWQRISSSRLIHFSLLLTDYMNRILFKAKLRVCSCKFRISLCHSESSPVLCTEERLGPARVPYTGKMKSRASGSFISFNSFLEQQITNNISIAGRAHSADLDFRSIVWETQKATYAILRLFASSLPSLLDFSVALLGRFHDLMITRSSRMLYSMIRKSAVVAQIACCIFPFSKFLNVTIKNFKRIVVTVQNLRSTDFRKRQTVECERS